MFGITALDALIFSLTVSIILLFGKEIPVEAKSVLLILLNVVFMEKLFICTWV